MASACPNYLVFGKQSPAESMKRMTDEGLSALVATEARRAHRELVKDES